MTHFVTAPLNSRVFVKLRRETSAQLNFLRIVRFV